MINGTLIVPDKATKGIIFLHSCERSHRDEDYFPELSNYLKEYNIATYRYDSPDNAFLQSFQDRKNEAINIYNDLSQKHPHIKWGFQGLSEGAVISLLASKELKDSFIIPAALELQPYSVERLLGYISDATEGNEDEIFLAKLWFDFFKLRKLEKAEIESFSKANEKGPWTPLLENYGRTLSPGKMLELTKECYRTQKDKFGDYQYMDYFINEIIEHNLDIDGFVKNMELWKEFTEVNPAESISDVPAFIIWGEKDDEVDIEKNISMVKELFSKETRVRVYNGLYHGLWSEDGYSQEVYKDIKDWILSGTK